MSLNSAAFSLPDASVEEGPSAQDEGLPMAIQDDGTNKVLQNKENLEENDVSQTQNKTAENHRSSKSSKTKLNVKIRGWNGVATWKWIANDDTCGICRVAFDGCCPDCKLPGDDCPLVWGACTHCFHIHCIMKWLNSQQAQHLCPMCRQDWKFKE